MTIEAKIYDIQGKLILSELITPNSQQIDISSIAAEGMYICKVIDEWGFI